MAPRAPQAEAPHIAGVIAMEDVTLSLDHPATPFINAAPSLVDPSVIPSLATNANIGTTADDSTTSLTTIGGIPLSLVDSSAIPSLITDVSMAIDHSATPPINAMHVNGDLNTQLRGTMSMLSAEVTISTAMSTMEPVSVHNTSAVSSLMSPERPEPSPNPLIVKLNNPVASTTQTLIDISASTPSNLNVPINPVIDEKGPTGIAKKGGIMRPNSHSKTAR